MNRRRRRDLSMAAELLCVACVSAAAAFIGGGRTSPVAPPLKLFPLVRSFVPSLVVDVSRSFSARIGLVHERD